MFVIKSLYSKHRSRNGIPWHSRKSEREIQETEMKSKRDKLDSELLGY